MRPKYSFLVKHIVVLFTENKMRPSKIRTRSLRLNMVEIHRCFGLVLLLLAPDALTVCMASWNLKTTNKFWSSMEGLVSESWVSVRGNRSSSRTMTQSILQKAHRNGLRQCWRVLKWSAMSPDLNPIEHLWRDLKTAVGRRHPSNLRHLEQLEKWSKIPVEKCKKLIDGFQEAIDLILFFPKGKSDTKYYIQGANNFVQSILVLCAMISDLAFFLWFFLYFSNVNKINKHVNTKTFVIATFFWGKWCIIWQKCRAANIFDHDCILVRLWMGWWRCGNIWVGMVHVGWVSALFFLLEPLPPKISVHGPAVVGIVGILMGTFCILHCWHSYGDSLAQLSCMGSRLGASGEGGNAKTPGCAAA